MRCEHGFSTHSQRAALLSCALIAVAGALVYANSIGNPFLWDDEFLVTKNRFIQSWSSLPRLFTQNIIAGAGFRSGSYRPLQMMTYAFDHALWGSNAAGYHLTNVGLHVLVALSLFLFVVSLRGDVPLAAIAGLLFAVHPVHTGAVTYISGRADPLATLFILWSLIMYVRSSGTGNARPGAFALAFFVFALLSKETSIILPLLVLLYHYSFRTKIDRALFSRVVLVALIYAALRLTLLRDFVPHEAHGTTFIERVPGFFVAIAEYLRLLALPYALHMEYGMKTFTFTDPRALCGAVIFVMSVAYAIGRTGRGIVTFGALWFFAALLPVSNLYPVNAFMAEHWLYLPSIGIFIVLASAFVSLSRKKGLRTAAVLLLTFLLVFYSFLTVRQNSFWRDPLEFYRRTLRYAPESAKVLSNIGNLCLKRGSTEEAVASYKRAIGIDPGYGNAYSNLGAVTFSLGKRDDAIEIMRRGSRADRSNAHVFLNLGRALAASGRREEALAALTKAASLNPYSFDTFYNLGLLSEGLGKREDSLGFFKKAASLDPRNPEAIDRLGRAYCALGRYEEAAAWYGKALGLDPRSAQACNNLGNVRSLQGLREEAIRYYRKAIALDPRSAEGYNNLGAEYGALGRSAEAIRACKRAVELDDGCAAAHLNLAIAYCRLGDYPQAIRHCDRAKELGQEVDRKFLDSLKPHRR